MKNRIINICAVLCLLVAGACGIYLGMYYYKSYKSEKSVADLAQLVKTDRIVENKKNDKQEVSKETSEEYETVDVDGVSVQEKFAPLYRLNRDFIGWITIDDTRVNYPVMYTPNDNEYGEYYIHRDFDKNYSAAGLPFIDRNCKVKHATDNIIIYGHNMNAGTMFHDIIQYENPEFYQAHKTFRFDTIFEDGEYEVIAMFYGEIYDINDTRFKYYEFVNAADEEEYMNFVNQVKKMSIIDTDVDVKYGDRLITLSTCAYHVEDGRFAVVAKKINSEK